MIQVFYLKKQEPLAKRLIPLLKREMLGDDDAHVDRAVIGNDYGRDSSKQEHIYCAKYVELLKASIISTSDFGTILLSGQDKWCYMGSDKESLHGSQPLLRLSRKNLALAFPAVAVLGRMVMLPQALHGALKADCAWLLKPLESGGVLLVNYRDLDGSVRRGSRQAGLKLRHEIARLCRRHMLVNGLRAPNFKILAELLGLDEDYLERHRSEILASMVKLSPRIISGPARVGERCRVEIEIENESDSDLKDVQVAVRAPHESLSSPVAETIHFGAHGDRKSIQFEVCCRAVPYCPLVIQFEVSDASQKFAPASVPLILDVSRGR